MTGTPGLKSADICLLVESFTRKHAKCPS
jgi:hypothetical protein